LLVFLTAVSLNGNFHKDRNQQFLFVANQIFPL
jgi:hypothetical protein